MDSNMGVDSLLRKICSCNYGVNTGKETDLITVAVTTWCFSLKITYISFNSYLFNVLFYILPARTSPDLE